MRFALPLTLFWPPALSGRRWVVKWSRTSKKGVQAQNLRILKILNAPKARPQNLKHSERGLPNLRILKGGILSKFLAQSRAENGGKRARCMRPPDWTMYHSHLKGEHGRHGRHGTPYSNVPKS